MLYGGTQNRLRGRVAASSALLSALRSELIASPPPTELSHPVYAELAAEAAGEPSVELLKEPEFLEWRLPDEQLKPYVDEIGQAGESVIVLSPVHKQERVNAVIDRATAELLSGDNRKRVQRRLEDIAYYLARVERRTQAGWATSLRPGHTLSPTIRTRCPAWRAAKLPSSVNIRAGLRPNTVMSSTVIRPPVSPSLARFGSCRTLSITS